MCAVSVAVAVVQEASGLSCDGGCKAAFQVTSGYDWTGDGNNIPPSPVEGVDSAMDCQAACYALTICVTFTYNGGTLCSHILHTPPNG